MRRHGLQRIDDTTLLHYIDPDTCQRPVQLEVVLHPTMWSKSEPHEPTIKSGWQKRQERKRRPR
jgi:hypothetical protein